MYTLQCICFKLNEYTYEQLLIWIKLYLLKKVIYALSDLSLWIYREKNIIKQALSQNVLFLLPFSTKWSSSQNITIKVNKHWSEISGT